MSQITPFVKRMRTQGGTIYTFTSALEDIGLNINERNNIVKMSHYALLNIPAIDAPNSLQENKFNIFAIPGAFQYFGPSHKDGRLAVAESFQNYALNLETYLLSQSSYNAALSTTVSERVFWKWLKETSAIRWVPVNTSAGTYWQEEYTLDNSTGYSSVVKCIGQISAGSVRTDTFGTYNETYILVPTSFGQTPVYFKQVEDDNYNHSLPILPISGYTNILGRETYLYPHPDGLSIRAYYDLTDSSTVLTTLTPTAYTLRYDDSIGSWTNGWWWTAENQPIIDGLSYFIDTSDYITSGIYNTDLSYFNSSTNHIDFKRSKVDCMSIEYNLNNLATIFNDSGLTFDSLALEYSINDNFNFNSVLIYYSVYNKALDKILATNLLGILFLDPASGNTESYPNIPITIPSITKLQSGDSGFGTSYSFRLNIKSDYMLDDTQAIVTDTTASQQSVGDFSEVFDALGQSLSILNQQTGTLTYITEQYLDITANQTNIVNQISDIQNEINTISRDITGTENTVAMFIAGDDPIGDSSIYMKNGNIGFFTKNPTYRAQFDVSVKVKDLIIENAIRDTSGNILIGYGSPLQIGSSTNKRDIIFYSGNSNAPIEIDSSNNIITFNASIAGNDINIINTKLSNNDSSISLLNGIKANTSSQVFTTSFGIGDWKFVLSDNNLVLTYADVSLFKFATDGSLHVIGNVSTMTTI